MKAPFWKTAGPYAFAVCSSLGLAWLTLATGAHLTRTPFALLVIAVFLSTAIGNARTGLLSCAVTVACGWLYVLPATEGGSSGAQLRFSIGLYAVLALATVGFAHLLKLRKSTLRETERRLRDFVEHAGVGLQLLSRDGRVVWANQAQADLLGAEVRDYSGRSFREFEAVPGTVEGLLARLSAGESLHNIELALRAADGTERLVLFDADVLWAEGRFVHARCFSRDLTARKAAEVALDRERHLLRTLIDNLPDLIYTKDRESRYLVSNLANTRVVGAGREDDVRGKSVLDFCATDDARRFVADDRWVIETGQPLFDREEPLSLPNGELRTLLTTKLPLRGPDGQVIGLVGISKDITDRKRADEALRKSEAGLRLAQRIGRIGSWEANLGDGTMHWSAETYRIFGCAPGTFVPDLNAFNGLVHPADREAVQRATAHALKHGKYYSVDYRIVRPDGLERHLVQQSRVLRDGAGEAVQLIGTVQDITERRLAEDALRESEHRFRILFERSPEAIVILDPHNVGTLLPVVDCNEAACRHTGKGRAEMVGRSIAIFDEGITSRQQSNEFVESLRQGRVIQRETSWRRSGGESLCVESSMSLIVVGSRELLLCISRDVSERRRAEEAIARLNEQLEERVVERTRQLAEANRELEAFSYSISHDLRAPVRAIGGFTQIILEDHQAGLDPEARRLLGIIANSACRMGEMIDDLLAFSNINARQPQFRPIDMGALVQSVVAETTAGPAAHGAVVEVGRLPEAVGDPSLLRQVLANLVSNALKFSREANPPRIEIGCQSQDGEHVYFVQDNGVGFEMAHADRLFQVFQRLHPSDRFEGTGVGLAIVHRIVCRHGGRIWATGAPGAGATFYFTLASGLPVAELPATGALMDGAKSG